MFSIPLVQMGARVYLPTLGRFLQVDPIEGGTPNSYVYATDPVNSSDYSGKAIPEKGGVNWLKSYNTTTLAISYVQLKPKFVYSPKSQFRALNSQLQTNVTKRQVNNSRYSYSARPEPIRWSWHGAIGSAMDYGNAGRAFGAGIGCIFGAAPTIQFGGAGCIPGATAGFMIGGVVGGVTGFFVGGFGHPASSSFEGAPDAHLPFKTR